MTAARDYNYVELQNTMNEAASGWGIRNERYKLITFENGTQEFYGLIADSPEFNDLLSAGLTANQQMVMADLEMEAAVIRSGWSCRDHITNGDETGIDCGTESCGSCTTSSHGPYGKPDVKLCPNPAQDYSVVDALGDRIESVRIFDLTGRMAKPS